MGRSSYHCGADVYLGANEASALVGAWRQLGSDVTINTPYQQPHHHHHRRGFGYNGAGGYNGGYNGRGFVPPTSYTPPAYPGAYAPPAQTPYYAPAQGGVQVRDHRSAGVLLGAMAAELGEEAERRRGGGPSPRAWLRDMPAPDLASRQVLPMNTGTTPVPQNSTAQITSRPQRIAFRPERVFVSSGGFASGGTQQASDWIINDITIGNRSQFAQSGALPGDMFAHDAIDSFVTFETAQTAMDIVMIVTYQGASEGGIPFYGAIIGTSAV